MGLTGIDWIHRVYFSRPGRHGHWFRVIKSSGFPTGEFHALEVTAQGADATSDLLAGIAANPEFNGFAPEKTTANQELAIAA